MHPQIIYKDPDFLVIDKPSGLLVHPPNAKDTEQNVAFWLLEKFPQTKDVGEDSMRPGIVHRLDRETSGLMIVALTQKSFNFFKEQFQEHKIKKTYLALVYGKVKNDSGTIDAPIGKIGTRQTTQIHGKKKLKEREAITHYKVLKRYTDYTLMEVQPKTGRTHQIRVHLKSIGNPVVCDKWYGGRRAICPPELGRLFLHAQKLEFTALSGKHLLLESGLTPRLQGFIENLAK